MSMRGATSTTSASTTSGIDAIAWPLALLVLTAGCPGDDGSGTGDPTTAMATVGSSSGPASTETAPGETTQGTDPTLTGPSTLDATTTAADSDTGNPTTGETPASCGDGVPDPDEACDDGNGIDADGCNNDCTISGSVLWFHGQPGGAGQSEEAWGIAVDSEGRAYVAGDRHNGVDLDHWIRQYEDDGIGWTLVLDQGGGTNDGARGAAVRGTTLYTIGYRAVAGQSNNTWLRSFDLDGNAGITVEYNDTLNGSNVGQGIAIDPGGTVIAVGQHTVGSLEVSHVDAWIRAHTPAGAPVWTANYGGAATDQARAVATDGAGNVAVVGYSVVGGQNDLWVRVFDPSGTPLWTATHANPNGLDDDAQGVAFDPDGNVVVAGWELDPVIPWRVWLTKYDPAGAELWTQPWDGETGEGARAFAVTVDDEGDIVITGQHRAAGVTSLLVRKLDPSGEGKWTTLVEGYEGTGQVGRAVAIGPGRRVWVAGGVDQGVDGRDAFVARLAP